jgi:PKD repeat protein
MKNRILWVLLLLLMAAATSHAQVPTRAEYFVDADPGVGLATPVVLTPGDTAVKDFSFSTGSLPPGYHILNVRVRDAIGRWGIAMSTWFYIYDTQNRSLMLPGHFAVAKAEYFFDTDPGQGMGTPLPLIRGDTVDVSRYLSVMGLDTGYHYLYIRALSENQQWGLAQRTRFHVDTSSCNLPVANYLFDTVTFGTPCHFTNLSTNVTGATQYKWDINNDGTIEYTTKDITHTFTSAGYYKIKLIVENTPVCKTMKIRDVVTGPMPSPEVLIAGSTSLCMGDSVILTSNNYEEGTTFEWSTGAITRALKVKTGGNYFCWVKNSYGISIQSVTVHVDVYEVPQVMLTYHNATGGSANGSAWVEINGGPGQFPFLWSNGATSPILNGLSGGNYSITVSDGHCPVIREFTVTNEAVAVGNLLKTEYYFDTDPGPGNGIPINTWAADTIDFLTNIPLGGLGEGFHSLYVRTRDTYGKWGLDRSTTFYIISSSAGPAQVVQPPVARAEYFFNTDPGIGKGLNIPITGGDEITADFPMPVNGLTTGFYNMFVRACDAKGKWSIYSGSSFYVYDNRKIDLSKRNKSIAGAEYFFDTDPGIRNGTKIKSNIYDTIDLSQDLRVSGLTPGTHYIYLRAYDEKGYTGLWQRASFLVRNVTCTCPVVNFTADTVNLLGNPTHFVNLSTSVSPTATYQWDVNGDGVIDYTTPDVNHVYSAYGLYNARLTVKNTDSCYASMTRQVVVSPVIDTSLTIVGALTLCDGNSVQITAGPGYSYKWSSDETTQSITVTRSGDYSVRLTNAYGVQGFSRVIHVTVYPLPIVQVVTINASDGKANGTAICNVSGGTGIYTYLWSDGNTLSITNNLSAGIYTLTVSDGRCPIIRTFTIVNDPISPGDIIGAEYFFDTEPGLGNGTPINISGGDSVYFATYLPMGTLLPGFHDLYIRVHDTYGQWSFIRNERFYVYSVSSGETKSQPPIVKAEYFFDQDPGLGLGTPVPLTKGDEVVKDFIAVTTGLIPGYHDLSVRAMDSLGRWSMTDAERMYVYGVSNIPPPVVQPKIIAAEYFFDTDPGTGNGIAIPFSPSGDLINLDRFFPVTGLADGSHFVYVRTRDEGGKWGIDKRLAFNVIHTVCTTPTPGFNSGTANAGTPVALTNTSWNLLPGTAFQWDINNDGTIEYTTKDITHTFAVSGNYDVKLTVINSDTCKASILRQVFVGPSPPATLTILGNTTFCTGDSTKLTASDGYMYEWWPTGETTRSIYVKSSGNYYCWLKTPAGIEVKSEVAVIKCYPVPTVTLHVIEASAGNSNGSAWVEVTEGSGSYVYQWSSGSTAMFATNLSQGSYTVQVSDGHCPVVKSFNVGTHPVVAGNIVTAEYFFDLDPGIGMGAPLNVSAADTIEYYTGCDLTGLAVGYHTLFIRVMDTFHKWSFHTQQSFYVFDIQARSIVVNQPPITSSEYFVDLNISTKPDPGVGKGTTVAVTPGEMVDVNFGYTVDTMLVGFHYIAARAADQSRKWSHIYPATFYIYDTTRKDITTIQPPIIAAEYFLDTDPGVGNGISLGITPGDMVIWDGGIPMGATSIGTHNLYVRVKDSEKKWSLYKKATFGVYQCTQPDANFSFVQTCINTPVQFTDLSTNVDPAATYAWDFNNDGIVDNTTHGSVSHQYTVPGIYQCKLKITHNVACFDSVIKTVVFPYVHLQNDTTIYTDQSIVLDGGPGYSYLWSTGDITQTITVNGATAGIGLHNYSVTVTNALSCIATDNINITVTLPPRDLVIMSASMFHDTIPVSGDSADLHCMIKNTGTISAVASVVQYFLSPDSIKSPSDQYLGFGIVSALGPGASVAVTSRLFIPAGPDGQVWYIIFVADGAGIVVESNEGNNIKPVSFLYGSAGVPVILSVHDQIVGSGQVRCYNALETITVGGLSFFQVQTGGSATFIAGLKIKYLPGTKVFQGGYMHGYITSNGQYCVPQTMSNPLVASDSSITKGGFTGLESDREPPGNKFCYIYPNPTNGAFHLILSSKNREWPVNVRIYNAYGAMIRETILTEGRSHQLSLKDQSPGIYFLHIGHGSSTEVEKVIRY